MKFKLRVVFYKNRVYEFPTKITISGCHKSNTNAVTKPYTLDSLETNFIETKACECTETPYARFVGFPDYKGCGGKCSDL